MMLSRVTSHVVRRASSSALHRAAAPALFAPHASGFPLLAISGIRKLATTPATTADSKLAAVLGRELQHERSNYDGGEAKQELESFLKRTGFNLVDKERTSQIYLTKSQNGEEIIVNFTASPFQDEEGNKSEEEDEENQQEGEQEEDDEPSFDDLMGPQGGEEFSVTVARKSGAKPGALYFRCEATPDDFNIHTVQYIADADVATNASIETDWNSSRTYESEFDVLDESVQKAFRAYLKNRGIDETMGMFVKTFGADKENREYIRWIADVREFVSNSSSNK